MRATLIWVMMLCGIAVAQLPLQPANAFSMKEDGLAIRRHVEAGKPFTVAGERGAILGQQEGMFEAWVLPVKLLSHFAIRASVEGYSVPIDLNANAAEIEAPIENNRFAYAPAIAVGVTLAALGL